jgi:hypothetical protein
MDQESRSRGRTRTVHSSVPRTHDPDVSLALPNGNILARSLPSPAYQPNRSRRFENRHGCGCDGARASKRARKAGTSILAVPSNSKPDRRSDVPLNQHSQDPHKGHLPQDWSQLARRGRHHCHQSWARLAPDAAGTRVSLSPAGRSVGGSGARRYPIEDLGQRFRLADHAHVAGVQFDDFAPLADVADETALHRRFHDGVPGGQHP